MKHNKVEDLYYENVASGMWNCSCCRANQTVIRINEKLCESLERGVWRDVYQCQHGVIKNSGVVILKSACPQLCSKFKFPNSVNEPTHERQCAGT